MLAGATLGFLAGRTVVRVNGAPMAERAPEARVAPILGRDIRGLQLSVAF